METQKFHRICFLRDMFFTAFNLKLFFSFITCKQEKIKYYKQIIKIALSRRRFITDKNICLKYFLCIALFFLFSCTDFKTNLILIDHNSSYLNSVPFSTPIATYKGNIYVSYVNDKLEVVVAKSPDHGKTWSKNIIHTGSWNDAHNISSLGIDSQGFIHVAYDMHDNPLKYAVSKKPEDITSFQFLHKMTGQQEEVVTYPHFYLSPSNDLWFLYREVGQNGGNLCLKKYNSEKQIWKDEFCPLIQGMEQNPPTYPYECNLTWDHLGNMHFFWNHRLISGGGKMNFRVSYAKYNEALNRWEKASGDQISFPITPESGDVADDVPINSGLSNTNSDAIDSLNRPHVVYLKDVSQDQDISEVFHTYFNGKKWVVNQVTHLHIKKNGRLWSLGRPQIIITLDRIYVFFTDSGCSIEENYAQPPANIFVVKSSDFGNTWTNPKRLSLPKTGEFTYDHDYFRKTGIARFFYQTTYSPTSPLYILEIDFKNL